MTRGIVRRLSRVESALAPQQSYRVVLRYEGRGTEQFRQPTEEELHEANIVLNIRSVPPRESASESQGTA